MAVVPDACPHGDAVRWNPYNRVVQCHRCGVVFVPVTEEPGTLGYILAVGRAWPDVVTRCCRRCGALILRPDPRARYCSRRCLQTAASWRYRHRATAQVR